MYLETGENNTIMNIIFIKYYIFYSNLFCLFHCRYRELLSLDHTIRHTHTHSVGLSLTSDRTVSEAYISTIHEKLKRKHQCPHRDSNLRFQQSRVAVLRFRPYDNCDRLKCYYGDKMRKDEVSDTCSTHGANGKFRSGTGHERPERE
jgi:hypothetical protein